jgi:hypothetical protein
MAWTNMASKSNGNVVDSGDWNQMVANFLYLGGTTGDVKTGAYSITGDFYAAGGTVTVGGPAAAAGAIRLANAANISWRNGGGSGDIGIQADAANRLVFSGAGGSWATTAGAATPANTLLFLTCVVNGSAYRLPLY